MRGLILTEPIVDGGMLKLIQDQKNLNSYQLRMFKKLQHDIYSMTDNIQDCRAEMKVLQQRVNELSQTLDNVLRYVIATIA